MPRDLDPIDRHLPLKPIHFYILLVLLDGERHGYGIVKEIEERTHGATRLEPGNLYRHLRRLMDQGFVEEAGDRTTETEVDERRIYYTMTPLGRRVTAAEAARMKALAHAAEARLGRRRAKA